jgi:hypothetical protein
MLSSENEEYSNDKDDSIPRRASWSATFGVHLNVRMAGHSVTLVCAFRREALLRLNKLSKSHQLPSKTPELRFRSFNRQSAVHRRTGTRRRNTEATTWRSNTQTTPRTLHEWNNIPISKKTAPERTAGSRNRDNPKKLLHVGLHQTDARIYLRVSKPVANSKPIST